MLKPTPPYAFTLLFIGRHLSEFFSYYPHGKDADLIRDIIQFEWAKIESFAASNAPSFNPETLTPEQTAQLPTFPLTLHPSVQILNLTFPVHRANFTKKKATTLIIYRKEYSINFLPIHPLFGKFLTSFYTPCSISDTIDTLLLSSTKKDIYILETSLQTWLNEAVQEEWFKSPHLKGEKNDPQSLMRAAIEPNL